MAPEEPARVEKPAAESGILNRAPMAPRIQTENVFDVFQPGLIRGTERLPYSPQKQYFYVEHPEEGWRVYLRAACFIHELYKPYNASRFIVVKRTDGDPSKKTWEPPKGQMEGRDVGREDTRNILQLLKENVRREVHEEAKIAHVRELAHTGLVIQATEPDYPANTYFQYHIFSGYAHPRQLEAAFQEFAYWDARPEQFQRLKSDRREKDAIAWYDDDKKIMGRWSPTIVKLYTEKFGR